ncbi:protein kinase domain protein [Ichthyophthirius multifiliis]|uniref:Protein kinase domain protein n=1 Tax=Ichthyophthirius multifiliis TaxID=5932 RepID=G0QZP7_ICHMU|nr:protein kinase domain protein [Ichthyophthirius multifiliis]EGR29303.1 protein kinase domain protein [Ichthyophthirius multifiliis]|eukprot:XP_004030539.1 protein kinase domain protein [Ichthyophthirius multifiliis]
MSKVIENYVLLEVIGSGQYGKVYRAKNIKNEQIVAIKVVQLEKFREVPKLHEFTMNEIRTLTKIDNPNCVRFQEMLKTSNNMYLIYEYCNGGTLEQAIHKRKFLSEQESIKIFAQLLNAFKSIIKENILHRDLKPSNILIHNNIIKIADFGFCKSLSHSHDMTATMVGSPIYMAPEVLKGNTYNSKADIWSLGVVFFECLFGYCPYEDQSIGKLITQIDNKELQIPRYINQISKKAEDLLRAMLIVDQKKRVEWHVLYQMTEEKFNINIQAISNQPIAINFQTQLIKKNSSSNLALQTNLRFLVKERNKIQFISNLIANVLEINLTSKVPIIAFMLIKQLNINIDQLKISCNDLKQSTFSKNIEKVELFENSYEFKQFKNIINRELPLIQGVFENFKCEINRFLKQQGNAQEYNQLKNEINTINQVDQTFFQQILFNYINEVQIKANELFQYQMQYGQSNNQFLQLQNETKQTFQHLNEMIDCFLIEEFFDNFIDLNTKFYDQKYFDNIKKYKVEALQELVNHKFDYIKQKVNQIAVS